MAILPRLSSLIRNLFGKAKAERDLNEEVGSYLEMLTEEKIKSGMRSEAGRRLAKIELGGAEQVKEQVREARAGFFMETLLQDIRYGLRQLRRNPGFAAVAVITLALGIGANTAIFSVVNGVLLNPLPYPQAKRLVVLYSHASEDPRSSVSYPNFLDWVRDNHSFSALAAYREDAFDLTGSGEPELVPAEMLSSSFFLLLGVKPVIGRFFTPQEDQLGAAPVVLISAGLWKRKFAASPNVLGKAITLSGVDYTIIGVVPSSFYYAAGNFHRSDAYLPIGQWGDPTFRNRGAGMGTNAIGRLKPGATLLQAKADMDALAAHLAEAYPKPDRGKGVTLVPLKQDVVGSIQPDLLVLLAAVGFVLLIACVNVANLTLARSSSRTREFGIRIALGAGRGRVIRQLLMESILLALAGGALGLLVAFWGLQAALKFLPQALPRAQEVGLDSHVLLFTLAASMLAGVLFGLAPALKSSAANIQETLKEGSRRSSGVRHRTQSAFVVAEVALALVLLAGAGLMIRSLAKLWSVNPGFDPQNVLTFNVSLPTLPQNAGAIRATWREMHDAFAAVPGVKAASLTLAAKPMEGDSETSFWLEGQPKPLTGADMKETLFYLVQPDYLKVLRISLERGRFLTPQDNEHAPLVTVIDEDFAKLYFPGRDPIGKRINFDFLKGPVEVVGVVGHVKQWGLAENANSPLLAQCYFPAPQLPDQFVPLLARYSGAVVRTARTPLAVVGSLRQAIKQVSGQPVIYDAKTMDSAISNSIASRRFSMILMGIFAALALAMATVGIYGVIAYITRQRTHEIGIRIALGARNGDILKMVVGQGLKMAMIGVAIGIAGALVLTRFLSSLLYGVKPTDPVTFIAVSLILTAVALVACYIPARRAAKVDPMVALRYE